MLSTQACSQHPRPQGGPAVCIIDLLSMSHHTENQPEAAHTCAAHGLALSGHGQHLHLHVEGPSCGTRVLAQAGRQAGGHGLEGFDVSFQEAFPTSSQHCSLPALLERPLLAQQLHILRMLGSWAWLLTASQTLYARSAAEPESSAAAGAHDQRALSKIWGVALHHGWARVGGI